MPLISPQMPVPQIYELWHSMLYKYLKLISLTLSVRVTFIAQKLQISWQNTGERPYVYEIVFKFKCIHGCWLKQLVSPSLNTTSLVHIRAFTYVLSRVNQPTSEKQNAGIFVLKTIRSREHSFPWWNFRSPDHSFPGTFVLKTICSLEHSFPGPLVPGTVCALDHSCPGPFVPRTNKHCRPFPPRTIRSLDRSFPSLCW